jgi:hypothetical protein
MLHDTVLGTLTLLAHAGRGVDPEELRAACRRDLAILTGAPVDPAQVPVDPAQVPVDPVDPFALVAWVDSVGPAAAVDPQGGAAEPPGRPLARRLDELQELAAQRGIRLRVHQESGSPQGPAFADRAGRLIFPPALDGRSLDAWSGALAECVANIARHADVQAADVVLGHTDDALVTVLIDEGAGFEPSTVAPERLGLSGSVSDRLADVGGRAKIWSRPGHGTVVELHLPLPRSQGDPPEGRP